MKSLTEQDILDACNHVVKMVNETATNVGLPITAEFLNEKWSDPCVRIMATYKNHKPSFTGFYITPMVEQKAIVLGGEQKNFIRYYVQHEVMVHGVYRYPDGSGEPDSVELVDDFINDSPSRCVTKLFGLYVEHETNSYFEAKYEMEMIDQMAKDEEEYYREMEKESPLI